FSSGQGRVEWRKVVNMLYVNNFLEFCPDVDMAEIELNQRFPRWFWSHRKNNGAHVCKTLLEVKQE
ncbi:MAG: hypothetical protein ABGY96_11175, partial [bacterium]